MNQSTELRDIASREDLLELLEDFYGRAFVDDLLGPVFVDIAQMDLAVHLPIIADFWSKVVLGEGEYRRNTLAPHEALHAKAGLEPRHFEQWLHLWRSTIDDRHAGPKAELAKRQGSRIAFSMCRTVTGQMSTRIAELLEATGHRVRR